MGIKSLLVSYILKKKLGDKADVEINHLSLKSGKSGANTVVIKVNGSIEIDRDILEELLLK